MQQRTLIASRYVAICLMCAEERERMSNDTEKQGDGAKPQQRKSNAGERRVLNHGQSSVVAEIGASLTLKQGALFMLTDDSGDIPPQIIGEHDRGLGLYFHDMRYLD